MLCILKDRVCLLKERHCYTLRFKITESTMLSILKSGPVLKRETLLHFLHGPTSYLPHRPV